MKNIIYLLIGIELASFMLILLYHFYFDSDKINNANTGMLIIIAIATSSIGVVICVSLFNPKNK